MGYFKNVPVGAADKVFFDLLCARAATSDNFHPFGGKLTTDEEQKPASIGTLAEKRLHSICKNFVRDDEKYQEIKLKIKINTDGAEKNYSCVADVLDGNELFEIQTGSIYPMKKKIGAYLDATDYTVTIIHPMAVKKRIIRINKDTGASSRPALSPKKCPPESLLPDFLCLLPYIDNPRLHFRILQIEADEYRLVGDKSRRGRQVTEKYELIPTALVGDICFSGKDGIAALLPDELSDGKPEFDSAKLKKALKIRSPLDFYYAKKLLTELGIIIPSGKTGNKLFYRVSE